MLSEITGKDNSRLKHARAVRDGRIAEKIFIEGLRLAEEGAKSNLKFTDFFFTPEFALTARGSNLVRNLQNQNLRAASVSEKLLASIAETKTPQGIVVLAKKPASDKADLENVLSTKNNPLLVILNRLNNPSNIGAILRTAEAAGVAATILTENTADVFSPKALRGSMGSAFRLPLWTNAPFDEAMDFCRYHEIKVVCAELGARKTHTEIDWTKSKALMIGSEAHGLTAEEISQTDESLKIPMNFSVESLNATVACGIVLFEAVRQRFAASGSWFET